MSNFDEEVEEFSLACDEDMEFDNYVENQEHRSQFASTSSDISMTLNKINYPISQENRIKSNSENKSDLNTFNENNKSLEFQLSVLKGKLKVVQDNSKYNYNLKLEEIKQLRQEMLRMKSESDKRINELKSKLEFSESTLIAAQQRNTLIPNVADKIQVPSTSTSDESLHLKFLTPQPTHAQKRTFNTSNFNNIKQPSPKKMRSVSNTDIVTKEDNESQTEPYISKENSRQVIVHEDKDQMPHQPEMDNKLKNMISAAQSSELTDIFDYSMVTSDSKYEWNVIDILELREPEACCIAINYDKMFGWALKALQAIIPLLNSCMNPFHDSDIDLTKCTQEGTILMSLQFQRLSLALRKRKGGIGDLFMDTLTRKNIPKSNLLVSPQYSCVFHYIYPVLEIITKMGVVAPHLPLLVADLLLESLIPSLFEFISYLCIDYCCEPRNNCQYIGLCRSFTNGLETEFVVKIIRFIIQILSQSPDSAKNSIFQNIFDNFGKFLPLLGGKIDLKIVAIELFCEMHKYLRFTIWISEHPDNCIMFTIMDLLDCACLSTMSQSDIIRLSNHISQMMLSLCAVGFRWSSNCRCSTKIFSMISTVCLNVAKRISETQWTDSNKACIVNILHTLNQIKFTYGLEIYHLLLMLNNMKEFASCIDYALDFQHPILPEFDFAKFMNLSEKCLLIKKIKNINP